jgi:tRNA A58 N-methylase Trm61
MSESEVLESAPSLEFDHHGPMGDSIVRVMERRFPRCEITPIGAAIVRHRPGGSACPLEVVELGCGTGFTTAAILAARPGVRLSTVDNEGQMVSQARRNLRSWIRAGIVKVAHYMSDEDEAHIMKEAEAVRAMRCLGFRSIRRPFRRGMDAAYLVKK